MYIGDFIKQYRDSNGVSIEDFATKAGLTVTEIEALEKEINAQLKLLGVEGLL